MAGPGACTTKQDYWIGEPTTGLTLTFQYNKDGFILSKASQHGNILCTANLLWGRLAFRAELNRRKHSTQQPINCSGNNDVPFNWKPAWIQREKELKQNMLLTNRTLFFLPPSLYLFFPLYNILIHCWHSIVSYIIVTWTCILKKKIKIRVQIVKRSFGSLCQYRFSRANMPDPTTMCWLCDLMEWGPLPYHVWRTYAISGVSLPGFLWNVIFTTKKCNVNIKWNIDHVAQRFFMRLQQKCYKV